MTLYGNGISPRRCQGFWRFICLDEGDERQQFAESAGTAPPRLILPGRSMALPISSGTHVASSLKVWDQRAILRTWLLSASGQLRRMPVCSGR